LPFELFRTQEGNFYQAVLISTGKMLGVRKPEKNKQKPQQLNEDKILQDSTNTTLEKNLNNSSIKKSQND